MKFLAALLFLLGLSSSASAQGVQPQPTEASIVKDSTGKVYAYAVWLALLSKGYSVKAVDPKDANSEFLLFQSIEKQAKDRMERGPKPRESSYFKTGSKIDLFKATDLDGNTIDIRDSAGKIIVLNFWFINCGPCRREIPELSALADSLKDDDRIRFYGIALDGKAELQEFLRKLPFHYTIIDNGRFIAGKYGIRGYPTHVILDKEGKVYFHTTGLSYNTVYWLKRSINELLAPRQM